MMASALHYSVPQEPGRIRALAMAVFVHAVLFAFLWVGIKWANDKPESFEAETWSPQELEAARAPVQPPEPSATRPHPTEVKPPPVTDDSAIRLQEEKKRLQKEKLAREVDEKNKAKQEENDKKQAALEQRKQDELDKRKRDKERAAEIARFTADANAKPGNGTARRSQGSQTESGWSDRVQRKVYSNISGFDPNSSDSNDPVIFNVRLYPDGNIIAVDLKKSSGIPLFDKAVRDAINKSVPYPADSTGIVPHSFESINYPKGLKR